MSTEAEQGAVIFLFNELPWEENPGAKEGAPDAMRAGVRRKWMAHGEAGFFVQLVEMPAGHVVQPHSHTASEFVLVLDGALQLNDGTTVGPTDSAVLPGQYTYGFTVGSEGVRFLIVRAAEASMSVPS